MITWILMFKPIPLKVLESYAMSIRLGHHHIYKSLPRLLTLWYDFGTQAVGKGDKKVRKLGAT